MLVFNLFAGPPDWQVDPSAYNFNVNITGRLYVNDGVDSNTGNIIAAFVNGEVRGVAEGQAIGPKVYYFLNIYSSNPSSDNVTFKVYLADEDQILDIEESFIFKKINSGSTQIFHTYLDEDFPINLNDIPDQTVEQGTDFDSIYLPDYLVQTDTDPIVWTVSGNTNLQIEITNDWLKMTPADTTWIGAETLTIIATEQTTNAYTASTDVLFTILENSNPPGGGTGEPPEWNVNTGDYSFSTNLTAQLYLNDALNNTNGNVIAAFVNDTLRGVATGTELGNEVYYFMTVYSSVPSLDTFDFKVYVNSEDGVYDIEERLAYNEINAGTIYELNSYLDLDQPISLESIPDQTEVEGFAFDSIYLPDYLIQTDIDPVLWGFSGNTEFQFSISQDWLIVESITSGWAGTEVITITATEQTPNAYSASQEINFTVVPDYGAPDWDQVPGQKIGLNQTFRGFDLEEYIFPYAGNSLAYNYFMPQSVGSDPDENWSFTAKEFQYSMNVTTHVRYGSTDHGGSADRLLAFIEGALVGIASPTIVNEKTLYFLTVYSDDSNVPVSFKLYDDANSRLYEIVDGLNFQNGLENGTPDNPMSFNTAPLEVVLDTDGDVIVNIEESGWIGTQQIAFIAYDTFQPLINADTSYADFTVVNEYAPEITGIADQYVELGTAFTSINLKAHYTELDGDSVTWSVNGNQNLNFSITTKCALVVTPIDPGWTGEETVNVRITDVTTCGLFTEQEVTYTIGAPNQAPEMAMVPDQIIGIGDTFPDLDLANYLTEPNGDPVTWTYYFKNQNLETANPAWSINPGGFQYSMTMTTQVKVREDFPAASGHQIAAFYEGQLRGLATAQEVNGDWMFFMNIYSNVSQDSIYFEYYDPDQNAVYAINDSLKFISQQQIGSVNTPFELHAGFIDPKPIDALLTPGIIDQDWLGSDTLFAIVTELGTFEQYRDTARIIFRVQATGPDLPVDLISFTGKTEEKKSILDWQIASPDNIQVYEIQRAVDQTGNNDLSWESIGIVIHEEDQEFYQFIDEQPFFTKNYYRLKMIDFDGSFEYSNVISLDFEKEKSYAAKLYPNPTANTTIYLDLVTNESEEIEIQIVDNNGRIWSTLNIMAQGSREFVALDLNNFSPGTYFARVKINYNLTVLAFSILSR